MIAGQRARDDAIAHGLRVGLILIALVGALGTALQLALDRHWGGFYQWLPWPAVLATAVAAVMLLRQPGSRIVTAARTTCIVVALVGVAGVARHVVSNYETAPLDGLYGLKWDSMSLAGRWWVAASGGVVPRRRWLRRRSPSMPSA